MTESYPPMIFLRNAHDVKLILLLNALQWYDTPPVERI